MFLLAFFVCTGLSRPVSAAGSKDLSKKNLIYMAYDDSGSMYRDCRKEYIESGTFVPLDRWNQAKYALEVFSTMMLEKDEMYIYPLEEYGNPDHIMDGVDLGDRQIHLLGTTDPNERVKSIEAHEFRYGQHTPYHSVKLAYEALQKADDKENTERWLVIVTDGGFDQDPTEDGDTYTYPSDTYIPTSELDSRFAAYASEGIHVVFLRIFGEDTDKEATPTSRPEDNIHVFEAQKSEDTLVRLNEISNLIFKRQALTGQAGQLSMQGDGIDIMLGDVPAGQLVVFAQGQGISVGDLSCDSTGSVSPLCTPIDTPEKPVGGPDGKLYGSTRWTPDDMIKAEGLGGVLATFDLSDNPAIGNVHIPVNDTSNLSVYVRPAVQPLVKVVQDGMEIHSGEVLKEGDAQIVVTLVNSKDPGQELDPSSSALLSSIKYDSILVNGEPWNSDSNSAPITLKAGEELKVEGSVSIEQSSYEMEEFTAQIRAVENLGDLSLDGKAAAVDPAQLYADLLAGRKVKAVSFTIMENGKPVPPELASAASVTPSSADNALQVDKEYDPAANTWDLVVSCTDVQALLSGEASREIKVTAQAEVATKDDKKSAEGSWPVMLFNPGHVGALTVAEAAVMDPDELRKSIEASEEDKTPCITFTLQEEGETLSADDLAKAVPSVKCTDEGSGVQFPAQYNSETGKFEAFLTCPDPEKLSYDGHTASIPFLISASLDRGDGPVEAAPVSGTLTFENPEHVAGLKVKLDPADSPGMDWAQLEEDPDSAVSFTVSLIDLLDGEETPLPSSVAENQVELTIEADQPDTFTFEKAYLKDNLWTITPKTVNGYTPVFPEEEPKELYFTFSVTASLTNSEQTASETGSFFLYNSGIVGNLEITGIEKLLDGDALLEAIRSGKTEETPCITFSLQEDGKPVAPEDLLAAVASVDYTGEGSGAVGFDTRPNAEKGIFEVYLSCPDPNKLKHGGETGHTASIPFKISASLDRGEGPAAAQPVSDEFSFEDGSFTADLTMKIDPDDPPDMTWQQLAKDPDSAVSFTVSLMDGGAPLSASAVEQVGEPKVEVPEEYKKIVSFTVAHQGDSTWIVTPVIAQDFEPDFSEGSLKFPFTVDAVLDRGGGDRLEAHGDSSFTLSLEPSGVTVEVDNPDSYAMKDMVLSEEEASAENGAVVFTVLKDGEPLTPEEWECFEITKDAHFVTKKGKELSEEDAKALEKFHLVMDTVPEESKILVYPWAEQNDLIVRGSRTLYPAITWQYTDYGIQGKEQVAKGKMRIKGLPWWIRFWRWLVKVFWWLVRHWYILVPVLVLLYIITRYLPRDYLKIIGRMYGFSLKKHTKASSIWKDGGIDKSNPDLFVSFKMDKRTVLAFWKNIEWTVCPLNGKDVGIRVYKDGTISLTKESLENLKLYKDTNRSKPLVSWGIGKDSYLVDLSEETTLAKKAAIHLLFLYHKINVRNQKSIDLRIAK